MDWVKRSEVRGTEQIVSNIEKERRWLSSSRTGVEGGSGNSRGRDGGGGAGARHSGSPEGELKGGFP